MSAPVPISQLDRAALLALNNAHARELSPLTAAAFDTLLEQSIHASGIADPLAFVLAFDERAEITGPNFAWFKARYPRFVYIDRVVVAANGRGRGMASALYADVEEFARRNGHAILCAEVNSDPPNPISDAFHERCGFETVGTATLADRGRTVRYLVKVLWSRAQYGRSEPTGY
jgi:predicted GNAT superfamily acetyltransferase